jgi:hypothetical protein
MEFVTVPDLPLGIDFDVARVGIDLDLVVHASADDSMTARLRRRRPWSRGLPP